MTLELYDCAIYLSQIKKIIGNTDKSSRCYMKVFLYTVCASLSCRLGIFNTQYNFFSEILKMKMILYLTSYYSVVKVYFMV